MTENTYLDVTNEESIIEWKTDATSVDTEVRTGFTLLFQPNYPEISLVEGTKMANGASGFRVVGVYGDAGAAEVTKSAGGDEDRENTRYVESFDWIVPNVTCTPTTMHCPIPNTWAHINYTTPSLYPEPAEGSCLQIKDGSSSLEGCSDKTDLNTRWYSAGSPTTSKPGQSQQNTQ